MGWLHQQNERNREKKRLRLSQNNKKRATLGIERNFVLKKQTDTLTLAGLKSDRRTSTRGNSSPKYFKVSEEFVQNQGERDRRISGACHPGSTAESVS